MGQCEPRRCLKPRGVTFLQASSVLAREGAGCGSVGDVPGAWYKKTFMPPDNHNGVITHLEPDILECEDKWG